MATLTIKYKGEEYDIADLTPAQEAQVDALCLRAFNEKDFNFALRFVDPIALQTAPILVEIKPDPDASGQPVSTPPLPKTPAERKRAGKQP